MTDGHFSSLASDGAEQIPPGFVVSRSTFADLPGWADADHEQALAVFATSLADAHASDRVGPTRQADWAEISSAISTAQYPSARILFEALFQPVRVTDGRETLFTGYYEPILRASRLREGPYQHPIYARPPDLGSGRYLSRAEIAAGALDGRGLELFWTDDPVDAFFLEIQGSGRLVLPDGTLTRIGFAAKNNHAYRAIGRILVDRGEMVLEDISAQSLKDFLRADPTRGMALMNENPSFVFFTERTELDANTGPVGAMGLPVSAGFTVAVDPAIHPLGAPIWVEADGVDGYDGRLMVAQDVGGAIKGAQRADLFIGSGDEAGHFAGGLRTGGRLLTLLPKPAVNRITAT
ncbi:MAG: MltA domain-containing protein [Pseudomonadota bacterium]